ncbi:MAG: carbohydrate-binding protein [Akkermansiaceae bacterium]|nr:carbohydrate-binding protein [Akkermansiaceae bacterium]
MFKKFLTALMIAAPLADAAEFHVSPSGADSNDGSAGSPFRTIQHSANVAQPGDTITVHEGVYRERIDPPRGGTSDTKRITYQAAAGETVVIKGSEPARGWVREVNDTWKLVVPNSRFGLFNPFNVKIHGDWFIDNGRAHHQGSVYLDGAWLTEATSKAAVQAAASGDALWHAEVDGGGYLMNVAWLRPVVGSGGSSKVDAVDYSSRHGVIAAASSEGGDCLGYIEDGDWAAYQSVDFGAGASQVEIRVATPVGGGVIELREGKPDGALLGTCTIAASGGWQSWQTFTATIPEKSGEQDLCLVFRSDQHATGFTTIRAQFPGVDPNEADVEISQRETVFYPSKTGINYLTVKGFTMEHAATPWAPPTSEQIAVIGTHWSKGWIIEDNTVRYSACSGISLGKYGDRYDNTSQNSATGYVETINRALANGWNKATIGSHVVRNNHVSHCEQAGIVGSLGCSFSTVTGNAVHDIHARRLFSGHEQAGIKFHGAIDVLLGNNHIFNNYRGIWLDWMTQGTRVTRNLMHGNAAARDLYVEVNHGPFMVDHNIFLSANTLQDWSQGGTYAHNLFAGTLLQRPETRRETPYHQPHSTTLAGSSAIQASDNRFYNNIFTGTASLGDYASETRPCFMGGNVFVNGASSSPYETSPLNVPGFNPNVQLLEKADGYYLRITLDGSWDGLQTRPLITTAMLGNAAVPNLPYEQADGTAYRLDTDFRSDPRSATNPYPGPFEAPQGGTFEFKVYSAVLPEVSPTETSSLDPMENGSFEQDNLAAGSYTTTVAGWTTPGSTHTRVYRTTSAMFDEVNSGSAAYSADGANALLLLNGSWINQSLTGTTDASPNTSVNLTAADLSGRTIRVFFSMGSQKSYAAGRGIIGLQYNNGSWQNFGVTLDTGTGTNNDDELYLDLAEGEWGRASVDITLPEGLVSSSQVLFYGLNVSGSFWLDDIELRLLPADDIDEDGLSDTWESSFFPGDLTRLDGTAPAGAGPGPGSGDYDGDGVQDYDEFRLDINPTLADSDGDSWTDYQEMGAGSDAGDGSSVPAAGSVPRVNSTVIDTGTITLTVGYLNPAKTYQLVRGLDLSSFPVVVQTIVQPMRTDVFSDALPPEPHAFYRVEEVR